jgi:hypothetical protein
VLVTTDIPNDPCPSLASSSNLATAHITSRKFIPHLSQFFSSTLATFNHNNSLHHQQKFSLGHQSLQNTSKRNKNSFARSRAGYIEIFIVSMFQQFIMVI